jgi:AcrR family transcriptional regulator
MRNMIDLTPQRGKVRNAQSTRETILNAAEKVFAEHGYDGARLDAIAIASGYNKSLIGQYFGDKLGLYTEVLKRTDRELNQLLADTIAPLLGNDNMISDVQGLRSFLATVVGSILDYLVEHPCFLRILTWEMAEGWQTYAKIASRFITGEGDLFEPLFNTARSAGWLRSDFPVTLQLTLIFQTCQSFLVFLPLYGMALSQEEMPISEILPPARERLVTWITGAIVLDQPKKTG